MRREVQAGAVGLVIAILAAGCNPYNNVERPKSPVDLPEAYSSGSAGGKASRQPWWHGFGDPALSQLIERALDDSFQLHAAWARLQQAQALAAQAGAPRWPQASIDARTGRQQTFFVGSFGGQSIQSRPKFDTFAVSVPVSYEVDYLQKYGAEAAAADFSARAARDDVEAGAMTLSAEVAEAWYNLTAARLELRLLTEQHQTNTTFHELVLLRFEQGLASAVDAYQQEQQLAATQSQRAAAEMRVALATNQLCLLLGKMPGCSIPEPAEQFTALPPVPAAGLPAELVARRPDVRAARRRVAAADARVGAAIADLFPRLRLSASIGTQATTLSDLFNSTVWSIFGDASQPLFDGGQRFAEIDRRKAVVLEQVANFGQTMIRAVVEVENALRQEALQGEQIEQLRVQVDAATRTLREANTRYREGLTDYLPVLTALATKYQAELALLGAERQLLSYRVQLHRALGGSWTLTLSEPALARPEEDDSKESQP